MHILQYSDSYGVYPGNTSAPTAPPAAFVATLIGPNATEGSGVTLTTAGGADEIMYAILNPVNDTTPKRLDVFIGGTQVAALDFPASYLGASLRYKQVSTGTIYNITFIDGPQNL